MKALTNALAITLLIIVILLLSPLVMLWAFLSEWFAPDVEVNDHEYGEI